MVRLFASGLIRNIYIWDLRHILMLKAWLDLEKGFQGHTRWSHRKRGAELPQTQYLVYLHFIEHSLAEGKFIKNYLWLKRGVTMVTRRFLSLSYRFDNAIIHFLNPQVVVFKKMYDSIGIQKNRSCWLMWLTNIIYFSHKLPIPVEWFTISYYSSCSFLLCYTM